MPLNLKMGHLVEDVVEQGESSFRIDCFPGEGISDHWCVLSGRHYTFKRILGTKKRDRHVARGPGAPQQKPRISLRGILGKVILWHWITFG